MTAERLATVHHLLDELRVDAALIATPASRCYLTGFTGDLGGSTTRDVALISRGRTIVLAYPIQAAWAEAEVYAGVEVVAHDDWLVSLTDVARQAGWERLAIEDLALSHGSVVRLVGLLGDTVMLVPMEGRLANLRARKDTSELDAIRRASAITDEVFFDASLWVVPGMSERAVARRINAAFYDHGADGLAFDVIVASGTNAAKPHHRPTDRVLAEGDPVIIDLGCRLEGYCSDLTRTLSLGPPSERFATLYNATLAARDAAVARVAPGVTATEVATAASDVFKALGLEGFLMHGLGHGLGLQIHEAPAIRDGSTDILGVGDVFSIEPGLYDRDWGGVRTEDVVVVTDRGCETITTAPTLSI